MSSVDSVEMKADLPDWLPYKIGNFYLDSDYEKVKNGSSNKHVIFQYRNSNHILWQALYDEEVKDYAVCIKLRLFEFTDISFIQSEKDRFLNVLKDRMEQSIIKSLVYPAQSFSFPFKAKGIDVWDFELFLPLSIGPFKRGITPDKAICVLNGSYIIAEYYLEEEETGLLLFYNTFRDEFFCELRKKNYPFISHELDAVSLGQLENALKENLERLLKKLIDS